MMTVKIWFSCKSIILLVAWWSNGWKWSPVYWKVFKYPIVIKTQRGSGWVYKISHFIFSWKWFHPSLHFFLQYWENTALEKWSWIRSYCIYIKKTLIEFISNALADYVGFLNQLMLLTWKHYILLNKHINWTSNIALKKKKSFCDSKCVWHSWNFC